VVIGRDTDRATTLFDGIVRNSFATDYPTHRAYRQVPGNRPGHNGITASCSSGTALPLAEVYLGSPAGTTRDLAVLSNCRFQQEG
jgi:hypothetical protein